MRQVRNSSLIHLASLLWWDKHWESRSEDGCILPHHRTLKRRKKSLKSKTEVKPKIKVTYLKTTIMFIFKNSWKVVGLIIMSGSLPSHILLYQINWELKGVLFFLKSIIESHTYVLVLVYVFALINSENTLVCILLDILLQKVERRIYCS